MKEVVLKMPVKGEVIPLSEVNDYIFSGKIIGDGMAVKATEGVVYSPVDGTVEMFYEAKHAVIIKTEDDLKIMIHIGIDTVKLEGRGFGSYVKVGDSVKAGDKIVFFDKEYIERRASLVTPVVIINPEIVDGINVNYKAGKIGDDLATVIMK